MFLLRLLGLEGKKVVQRLGKYQENITGKKLAQNFWEDLISSVVPSETHGYIVRQFNAEKLLGIDGF